MAQQLEAWHWHELTTRMPDLHIQSYNLMHAHVVSVGGAYVPDADS